MFIYMSSLFLAVKRGNYVPIERFNGEQQKIGKNEPKIRNAFIFDACQVQLMQDPTYLAQYEIRNTTCREETHYAETYDNSRDANDVREESTSPL
jgi:hypothetical protein